MSEYLECYRRASTKRSKMGSNHSVKQSQTCHTNLVEQCDRLWQSLSFFRLVRVRADQKFDLHHVHPLLKCWAQISLRFWLILVCTYVAKTLKYLCSNSLGTKRLFIECFNDWGCFSDLSITVLKKVHLAMPRSSISGKILYAPKSPPLSPVANMVSPCNYSESCNTPVVTRNIAIPYQY